MTRWRTQALILAAAVVLLAIGTIGAVSLRIVQNPFAEQCTVWNEGTEANITAIGDGATDECTLIQGCRASCKTVGYQAAPDGRVVCEHRAHGLDYVVRERAPALEPDAISWCFLIEHGRYPDNTTAHAEASPDPS